MEQRELESLLRSEAYPDAPQTVHLKQTHISYLFLTDRFVYKIKKPVDFGFLNFSTIDRRRFYCHEEVRLNRRLSPDIYLGVVELRRSDEGVAFTGSGPVVDYAVKMVRLPEERMMDRLLSAGQVQEETIRSIARVVAAFHQDAERGTEIDRYGTIEAIRRSWDENFALAERFVGDTLSDHDLQCFREWVNQYLQRHAALFEERIARGFIRDCDGDLHLENICLGEKVWIFDCIEFNPRFRYGDTAADIAFLLMDLDYHDRSDLAAAFLDEYVTVATDETCVPLVEFYKVYRAFVRGKVASLQLLDRAIPAEDRDAARDRAIGYFRLARGYLLRQKLPVTIFLVGGLMGSGKSTLAQLLGRELGIPVLSSDRTRKELYHATASSRSALFGTGPYTPEADRSTYDTLLERGTARLQTGKSVIIDATFRKRADRQRFRQAAAALGVDFRLIMTDCPDELIRERLTAREGKMNEISDGRLELFDSHLAAFEQPDPGSEPFLGADTSGSIRQAVDEIMKAMGILP